jgi:hypothetical protein
VIGRHRASHTHTENKHPPPNKSRDTPLSRSESACLYGKISAVTTKTGKGRGGSGPLRGRAQSGRPVTYDPSSGQNWRTGVVIVPDMAEKAIEAGKATGLSFAGLVNELIKRMPVDENGRPVWADELSEQPGLPLTG